MTAMDTAKIDSRRRGRRQGVALLIVFLAALLPRLPYALTRGEDLVFADSRDYESIARSLLSGGGFREEVGRRASRAPGYPIFLAGCYSLGMGHSGVYVLQAVIDAAACVLLAVLAFRLGGPRVGLTAGLGAAIFPFFIYFTGVLLAETLFTLALVGCVLLLERASGRLADKPRNAPALAAAAGVAAGLAIHLRSSFLLFPLFLLPFWLLTARPVRWALVSWLVMAIGVGAVLAPWVVRNYRLFHRFVPATLQVGESLYEANSPHADGGPAMDRIDWVAERGGVMMSEFENNDFFRRKAFEYIQKHPRRFVALAAEKMRRFWNPVPNYGPYQRPLFAIVGLLANVPVYVLAVTGILHWRKRRVALALLLTPVLYYAGLHAVFVGSVRYRVPVMPFLIVLAAAALVDVLCRRPEESGDSGHG